MGVSEVEGTNGGGHRDNLGGRACFGNDEGLGEAGICPSLK